MEKNILPQVLEQFSIDSQQALVLPLGNGLINYTWKVEANGNVWVLQRINTQVFKKPEDIAANIEIVASHLAKRFPGYSFITPVRTSTGNNMYRNATGEYFRLFPFVKNSHTIDVVQSPDEAYEAAAQFGRFTSVCSKIDTASLKITIPDFHNLRLRQNQYLQALQIGNEKRIAKAHNLISQIKEWTYITEKYEQIKQNTAFRLRVTHHDTKISNVLFNKAKKGICVIDYDTIMPGYFISDTGDMMRTYLSPVSEEETSFDKINVRDEYYKAIEAGYCDAMKDELTAEERNHFYYSGLFMIYMQALRFLTDYIQNDVYYGSRYPGHNFNRAGNQVALLQGYQEKQRKFAK